jgi:hypothetical protein
MSGSGRLQGTADDQSVPDTPRGGARGLDDDGIAVGREAGIGVIVSATTIWSVE